MKNILIILILLGGFFSTSAQTISRDVISSSGGSFTAGANQLDFTIGETLIATLDTGGNIVTQGFQQPCSQLITDDFAGIIAPLDPVQVGAEFNLSAEFNGSSLVSGYWYFSSNGDLTNGDTAEFIYPASITGGVVTDTFSFDSSQTGVYTAKLVVTDACGETAETSYHYIVVYDPIGGFVTGRGWIWSPKGALAGANNYNTVGKANFGFVAEYKTGMNNSNEVDGKTNFQFKEGDFHFKSSSHKEMSLVISGERKATYKGSGTVNGSGSYDFMVTVIDGEAPGAGQGDVDTFRIKVWTSGSPSDVVYDNELGNAENADATTDLGGGSIIIQKPKGNGKEQEGTLVKTTPIIMQEMDPEILESLAASPNPVVSSSTVRFSLKEDANVVLRVYDYSGRMIETLYNGQVKAYQNYDMDFQRKNLMSGIYIVKLTTDKGQSYDKRIIVE